LQPLLLSFCAALLQKSPVFRLLRPTSQTTFMKTCSLHKGVIYSTKPCCQMSATCSLFCFDHCNALTFVSLALSSITSVQAAPANQFHQYHHEYRQPLFMARADLNVS
ncbi:hypothetical protein KCV06_g503, partial [Aureobasidium melanogenum]